MSCKAQSVVSLDSDETIFIPDSGSYYKDTNNLFNVFEGQWVYENIFTDTYLEIILKKEENIEASLGFTYDLLVGEYKYEQDGEVLANTLLDIENPNITGRSHKISGVIIMSKYMRPLCEDCLSNERRLQLSIRHDNFENIYGGLILRHIIENGVEKLKIIVMDGSNLENDPNAPDFIDIPFGEYILTKVD